MATIIIPYHNRVAALLKTLDGLAAQTISAEEFEVIVVDDGSSDDATDAILASARPFSLRLVRQQNEGPGVARNRGSMIARADLLIFLDADMIPANDLIQRYCEATLDHVNTIFIGRQLPWPEAFASPKYSNFNYVLERDPGPASLEVPFHYIASGNFAIATELFHRLEGFDAFLKMTEDTELAYRAYLAGIHFRYLSEAIGYHNHPKTFEQRCLQLQASAWWTAHLLAKHPDLRGWLPIYRDLEPIDISADNPELVTRKIARRLLALPLPLVMLKFCVRCMDGTNSSARMATNLRNKISGSYRLIGFRQGLKEATSGRS